MSATRDPSSKVTFIYENLYRVYQQGKTASKDARPEDPVVTGRILKAGAGSEYRAAPAPTVKPYRPMEMLRTERRPRPEYLRVKPSRLETDQQRAVGELKSKLEKLQGMHRKMRFYLSELEDFVGPNRSPISLDDDEQD